MMCPIEAKNELDSRDILSAKNLVVNSNFASKT